ncbi:MAG: hypothetical protein MK160_11320 [Rhodobacteraceae bacterium]|nr:hypothetical protein [Paracoccaceae bacterium]
MSEEVLAKVGASAPRRAFGVATLLILGFLLLYVAFATPPAFGWQAGLVGCGVVALYVGQGMWRATQRQLILTPEAISDDTGYVIVQVKDVEKVDRGMFAFKPSNGFLIKTKTPQHRAWHPGLWWRMGHRVAVGGVTAGSQTRPMADILAAMIAERKG